MSSRSLFQYFKSFEINNDTGLNVAFSYPSSKEETRKQMVDLLLQSSLLYKKNEKSLTKKEKNSYMYYANTILYKIVHNFLQEYYSISSSSSSFSSIPSSTPSSSEFSPLKKLSFLTELTKLFLSYFALTPTNRIKYETIFSKEFVNSLYNEIDEKLLEDVDTEDEGEEERPPKVISQSNDTDSGILDNDHDSSSSEEKSDSLILSSFYKAENRLWILLLFSVKNLLELRKKDSFHFQAQYRLSLILYDLEQMKASFPLWISRSLVSSPSPVTSASSSVPQPQQNSTVTVSTTGSSEVSPVSAPVVGNPSSELIIPESQLSQSYQHLEEVPLTAAVITYFTEEPFVTKDPKSLIITNTLLLSFLSDLSIKKSFLEMNKLFERRLPQIVAMWHDHIPDNPWEKVKVSKF
jgi:hypothetical protein